MKYNTKCPICKENKPNVEWHFSMKTGCKDCADKYMKSLINGFRKKT